MSRRVMSLGKSSHNAKVSSTDDKGCSTLVDRPIVFCSEKVSKSLASLRRVTTTYPSEASYAM
jgi:hypothetical protein